MGKLNIEATLYKGEDEVEQFDEFEGNNNLNAILNGAQLAFDKGSADKVSIFLDVDGELMDIHTITAGQFDRKQEAVYINEKAEEYGAQL
jgi:hypothetical protein